VVFLAITLSTIAWLYHMKREDDASQALWQSQNDSNNAFLVNNHPVEVHIDGLLANFDDDDALDLNLTLVPISIPMNGSTDGLADEESGILTPTITMSDCKVEPETSYGIRTDQPLAAFTWHWSAVCHEPGKHDVSALINFTLDQAADAGTSDPIAYHWWATVTSRDPLYKRLTALLAITGTIITLVSSALALYEKIRPHNAKPDRPSQTSTSPQDAGPAPLAEHPSPAARSQISQEDLGGYPS
jgi:hypothetical protein